MSVMIPLLVDAVTGRAVLEIVEMFFDFFGQAVYDLFFFNDLQRGVADDAAAEGGRGVLLGHSSPSVF